MAGKLRLDTVGPRLVGCVPVRRVRSDEVGRALVRRDMLWRGRYGLASFCMVWRDHVSSDMVRSVMAGKA